MKFRKKPVVIEAVLFEGIKPDGRWMLGSGGFHAEPPPDWFQKAHADGTITQATVERGEVNLVANWKECLWIKTLEGGHIASPGDWIIQGVKGELYPCKPDIFEATYEAAE